MATKPAPKKTKAQAKRKTTSRSVRVHALTPAQLLAIDALLAGKTRAEAAKAAGVTFEAVNYMAALPHFKAELARRRDELEAQVRDASKLTALDLIRELLPALTLDPTTLFTPEGALLPMDKWPPGAGKALAGFDVFEEYEGVGAERTFIGYTKKVKFWNKPDVADKLAKIIGAYKPVGVDFTPGSVQGMKDVLQELWKRGADVGPGPSTG